MGARKIRVLVVDDSALIREIIVDTLSGLPDMEVVGTAADGIEALKVFDRVEPDVVTLDVQMPKMGGLETLQRLLAKRPVPVIMVSALTQVGATTAFEALLLGAVDYVPKPKGLKSKDNKFAHDLARKIRMMAGADVERLLEIRKARSQRVGARRGATATPRELGSIDFSDKCIAIGISTGGPPALTEVFGSLQPPMPPIVVVQHMPPGFTTAFAWRLDSATPLSVKEAQTGDQLKENHVYLAPGGRHMEVRRKGRNGGVIRIRDGEPVSGHRPSVDVMMTSVVNVYRDRVIGIIMTGMGRDGADGCKAIREAGGYVLGQDEATSDVYGMNKVAWVEGGVDRQFALGNAAREIARAIQRQWGQSKVAAR